MKDFFQKLLIVLEMIGKSLLSGVRAIGTAFRNFGIRVKNGVVKFGLKIARIARSFATGVAHFPKNFVAFWKSFGIGVANFFRSLPETFKSKDKVIDLLIGTAATVIWCMPVFVVVYVLAWFLSK